MNKVLNMFSQDFKLLLRNAIFWVISVTLLLVIVTVNFLIPKDFSTENSEIIVFGINSTTKDMIVAESAKEVETLVMETGGVGVVKNEEGFTVISVGLSDQAAAGIIATLTANESDTSQIEITNLSKRSEAPAQNLNLMPIFICFEAVVLGFLMAAILMLGEKQDNVLKAYRISPGGTFAYIFSKVLLFVAIGSVYALLMTITTVGFGFNVLYFLLLTMLGCILYTLLGLSVAIFFKDVSGWFFVAALILALNMLPMVSYSIPTFSPSWIEYIPSYPMLFAYRDILFDRGKSFMSTYILFACEITAAFGICAVLIKKKLLSDK